MLYVVNMHSLKRAFVNNASLVTRNVRKGISTTCFQRSLQDIKDVQKEDLPITLEKNPFEKPKKQCILCKYGIEPDYKNVRLLSQFQSRYTGKVYDRHITGLCKQKQEDVIREIARAQAAGLMGYYTKDPAFARDPALFDPNRPFRPHPH